MQFVQLGALFAVFAASRTFAAVQAGNSCQYNWKWLGQSCEAGLNCVLLGNRADGLCLDYDCSSTVAPETILPSPTTVTADTTTTSLHLHTVTHTDACRCWPTLWYTATVTATPPPYQNEYPYLGECTQFPNGVCPDGASCVTPYPQYPEYAQCATANCLDAAAPTTTKFWPSTITEAGPGATTVTVTDTATVKVTPTTGGVTCSCSNGPSPTTTFTYYVSPTPTA